MVWGWVSCGPNQSLVISGCCYSKPLLIPGGRAFVWPCIHQVQEIPLQIMTLQVESKGVYSHQGVPITVTGIAQVKIEGSNEDLVLRACEAFLGKKSIKEIEHVARETLEGHQRAIIGNLTVEEIYKDRKKFNKTVYEVASADLLNMGMLVISYTLKDVRDDGGYLIALGAARIAEVQRDARIGEAEAKRDSKIKQAQAEEQRLASKYSNDTEIAKAKRDFELKMAAYNLEVNTKQAESRLAYALQEAKTRQLIIEEKMQIEVVQRQQEIAIQDQEILRRQKELDATVRRPAEAEKYRLEKIAEANRNRVILEAEAESEAIKIKGDAEAFARLAKGKAEAEQLTMKADAYKYYKDAAIIELILESLPKVSAAIATPLAEAQKVTMISMGGEIGASRLTTEVLETVLRVPQLISTMTGFDLSKALSKSSDSN